MLLQTIFPFSGVGITTLRFACDRLRLTQDKQRVGGRVIGPVPSPSLWIALHHSAQGKR